MCTTGMYSTPVHMCYVENTLQLLMDFKKDASTVQCKVLIVQLLVNYCFQNSDYIKLSIANRSYFLLQLLRPSLSPPGLRGTAGPAAVTAAAGADCRPGIASATCPRTRTGGSYARYSTVQNLTAVKTAEETTLNRTAASVKKRLKNCC